MNEVTRVVQGNVELKMKCGTCKHEWWIYNNGSAPQNRYPDGWKHLDCTQEGCDGVASVKRIRYD